MDFLLPRLALGCFEDVPFAYSAGITRILTLCEACPTSDTIILHCPIPDEVWLPRDVWNGLIEQLSYLLDSGQSVLVHCRLGVSRSPTLVAAYLACAGYELTLESALAYVHSKRACVKPHSETWRGMREWWEGRSQ